MLCGGAISWASHMQRTVATSSAESEYAAASDCCHEALWLRKLFAELFDKDDNTLPPTKIHVDNKAAEKWCFNPINHAKQKHIDVAYHFIREQCVEYKNVIVVPIASAENVADIGTKPLPFPAFEKLLRQIMNLKDRSLRCPTTSTMRSGQTSPTEESQAFNMPPTPAPTPIDELFSKININALEEQSKTGPTPVPTPVPTFTGN